MLLIQRGICWIQQLLVSESFFQFVNYGRGVERIVETEEKTTRYRWRCYVVNECCAGL